MKKATVICCGVLLCALFAASSAKAQCIVIPAAPAPDMCGPGFYAQNCCGAWYGPNYCVYPPFPPFNGMIWARPAPATPGGPGYGGGMPGYGGSPGFPTHPFVRSPRDFFMIDEKR
jgi:hypothetical protein